MLPKTETTTFLFLSILNFEYLFKTIIDRFNQRYSIETIIFTSQDFGRTKWLEKGNVYWI